MTITESKKGWLFLTVVMMSCLVMAAVATANSQDPGFGVLLALAGLGSCVLIYELTSLVKATPSIPLVLIFGVIVMGCFWVLMAVGESVIAGHFSIIPSRLETAWFLPFGIALWTAYQVWQHRSGRYQQK